MLRSSYSSLARVSRISRFSSSFSLSRHYPRASVVLAQSIFQASHISPLKPIDETVACRFYSSSKYPPSIALEMPALSPTMEKGNIIKWKKKVGDKISPGDELCEVETDKASVPFESTDEGYLAAILVPEGSEGIPVGKKIGLIVEDQSEVEKFQDYKETESEKKPKETTPKEEKPIQETKEKPTQEVEATDNEEQEQSDSPSVPSIALEMPALSPTMEKGNIIKWKKKVGDKVKAGDELCEVETDKASVPFESTDEGYLAAILVPEGSEGIPVGKKIGIIVEDQGDVEKFKDYKETDSKKKPTKVNKEKQTKGSEEKASKPTPTKQDKGDSTRLKVSPAARVFARENGIDLTLLKGTGPNDRIIKADVADALASKKTEAKAKPAEATTTTTAAPQQAPKTTFPTPDISGYTDIPLTNLRKIIATRLQQSKQILPHYYLTIDCNVDNLLRIRQELNGKAKNGEYKLSINDFVVKASALALKAVPTVNSSWQETFIRKYETVHINVAVNTDNGLYIPLITNTDAKGLIAISNQVRDLAAKAKANKLSIAESSIGTFTVSNLGAQGLSHFSAVINPPQAAILAVGSIQEKIVPDNSNGQLFKKSSVMSVTLSCDHRVVDGAVGAQWLQVFKQILEDPLRLLL